VCSSDLAAVDYWADSGWPHDRLTFDGSNPPSPNTNRFDLVMNILATYPSGATQDAYTREKYGYNSDRKGWYTVCYRCTSAYHVDGGGYHSGMFAPIYLSAEMAYHNGMTGVFGIKAGASDPAILSFYKRAIESQTESDYRPTSRTGHPDIAFYPMNMTANRRYHDNATIKGALSSLHDSGTNWIHMVAQEVWPFLGFPPSTP